MRWRFERSMPVAKLPQDFATRWWADHPNHGHDTVPVIMTTGLHDQHEPA
jgi:hypothetical protein